MICVLPIPPDNGCSLHAVWGLSCYALPVACKRNLSVFILPFGCLGFVLHFFFNLNLNVYTVVCVEHSLCLFVREVASSVDLMKIPHIDIYFHVACVLQRNICSCSNSCLSKQ